MSSEYRPHQPISDRERELLRPRPPQAPWPVIACRNLHRHAATFAEAELDESVPAVIIRSADDHLVLTADDDGWHSDPPCDELDLPLDNTVRLGKRLHSRFTGSSN